jgi:hypothetical protein
MPKLVTTSRVRRERLEEILAPRNGLVVEEPDGSGGYVAINGPVEGYARRVEVGAEHRDDEVEVEVTQTVEYKLTLPFLGWMLGLFYRIGLGRLGSPQRHPWWAPPEPIDPRAGAM